LAGTFIRALAWTTGMTNISAILWIISFKTCDHRHFVIFPALQCTQKNVHETISNFISNLVL